MPRWCPQSGCHTYNPVHTVHILPARHSRMFRPRMNHLDKLLDHQGRKNSLQGTVCMQSGQPESRTPLRRESDLIRPSRDKHTQADTERML